MLRARFYRLSAFGLMVAGIVIMFFFYGILAEGDVTAFLKNPVLMIIMLLPFIPAYIFAIMHKKARSGAANVLKGLSEAGDMNKKRTDLYSSDKL